MSSGLDAHVPLPTGRRLVIPDIHGCAATLHKLLQRLELTFEDQLFFLGDYINKGPDSLGVLTCIEGLIEQEYNVFPLLGNHDLMMHQYLETGSEALENKIAELNCPKFMSEQIHEFEKHRSFLRQLAGFHVSGDFLLVHAGFDYNRSNPYDDLGAMLTIRDFSYDNDKAQNKKIIHGHHPHSLDDIQTAIRDSAHIIPLDNGCVYENRDGQGNLVCLNLDNFKLWVQPNVENQSVNS